MPFSLRLIRDGLFLIELTETFFFKANISALSLCFERRLQLTRALGYALPITRGCLPFTSFIVF